MRLAAFLLAGCTSTYAYTFHVDGTTDDGDVAADVRVDAASQVVHLGLTNKTDQVMQVEWSEIAIVRADGHGTELHPDADLGWLQPGATLSANLFPLAFPRHARAALADDNGKFELRVPVIVRREQKVYRYHLTAHVVAM